MSFWATAFEYESSLATDKKTFCTWNSDYEFVVNASVGGSSDYQVITFDTLSVSSNRGYNTTFGFWFEGKPILTGQKLYLSKREYPNFIIPITVKGHWSYRDKYMSINNYPDYQNPTFTVTCNGSYDSISSSEYAAGNPVSDVGTQQRLDDLNETQESIKDTAEDTNETTHSIFDSISDFFGSFFDNLIGVFVPEDGYFTTWFNNLNALLTQKLGVLYYPFSVLVQFLNDIATSFNTSQPNSCVIVVPALKLTIQGTTYTILERQQVDLYSYNINLSNADTSNSSMFGMTNLIWVIRRFTGVVFVFATINLFIKKVQLILRGSEEG